jgi:hypothetical protein
MKTGSCREQKYCSFNTVVSSRSSLILQEAAEVVSIIKLATKVFPK